jgi:hypothetical protein
MRVAIAVMAKLVIRTEGLPVEAIELKPGVNRLGRSIWNDFQINHHSISRFHAEVELQEDVLFVRDMDSSNGTFLNDEMILQAPLEDGQVLRLGDVLMEVCDVPKPRAQETPPCFNHPALPASMVCTQCGKHFCGACIHILKRLNGQMLRLCPVCSGHCDSIRRTPEAPKKSLGNFVRKLLKKPPPQKPFYGKSDGA